MNQYLLKRIKITIKGQIVLEEHYENTTTFFLGILIKIIKIIQ